MIHRVVVLGLSFSSPERYIRWGDGTQQGLWHPPSDTICNVRWCFIAACCCEGASSIQSNCGLESSRLLYSGWHADIIRTHTHVHINNTVRGCHENKTMKYGCCCTMHGCHNVESSTFGVIQAHSSRQQRQPKRELKMHLCLFLTLFA